MAAVLYESDDGLVSSVTVSVPQRKTMPHWQGYAEPRNRSRTSGSGSGERSTHMNRATSTS